MGYRRRVLNLSSYLPKIRVKYPESLLFIAWSCGETDWHGNASTPGAQSKLRCPGLVSGWYWSVCHEA